MSTSRHEVDLAEQVGSLTPEQRTRLAQTLRKRRDAPSTTIARRPDSGPAPLSFSQESLWFLEQWDPGAPTNHGVRALHLSGELDVAALRSAL
jgi:hypothetical protein